MAAWKWTGSNDELLSRQTDVRFWTANMAIMAFLGLNKQLDIQTLFTEIGRELAHTGGWYDHRQTVQMLFILSLLLLAVIAIFTLLWSFRRMAGPVRVAAIGLCSLVTFIVMRAASFHHVDQFLGKNLNGFRWNGILELGGILIISAAAWQHQRKKLPKER